MLNFLFNHTPLLYLTQSLWRDEAFSVWIAQDSVSEVIRRTSGDFNPPLYYVLLHFWMRLFGRSETALRSLSLVAFGLFLVVVFVFAKKLFNSQKMAIITTLLAAFNPMLLYFAFELRMYALLCLLSVLSMYFLYSKKWVGYVLATVAGLYTQPFMAFVVLTQISYFLIKRQFKTMLVLMGIIGILYLPWVPTLLTQFKSSGPMWMYPINLSLVLAVLGNLYVGYEGTPGGAWWLMYLISLGLILAAVQLWKQKKTREQHLLTYLWIIVPLVLVLGTSVVKPIYVHRYVIFVSTAEVFLLGGFLSQIKNRQQQSIIAAALLTLTLFSNFFVATFHRKVAIRDTFARIIPQLTPQDVVYAQTPLIFYESLYYAPKTTPVLLYNPQQITPPRYVGSVGMPQNIWALTYPTAPKRAFVIEESGNFHISQTH